jgi:hypothetical protein
MAIEGSSTGRSHEDGEAGGHDGDAGYLRLARSPPSMCWLVLLFRLPRVRGWNSM